MVRNVKSLLAYVICKALNLALVIVSLNQSEIEDCGCGRRDNIASQGPHVPAAHTVYVK
jgi:hypothetical protein